MSRVELAKMSSKGQVVVPQEIRQEVGAVEGTVFAVFGSGDSIIFKKVEAASKQELLRRLEQTAVWGEQHAKKIGVIERDVPKIIHGRRGVKE